MSWRRTHRWGALSRDEIGQARDAGAFAVLPAGSVEQHGAHLPVDTDLDLVEHVALAAAERCVQPWALVLPALPFGVAPEHAAWAGTITLSPAVLTALLEAVAASVRRAGFARLLVVNGHGGNAATLSAWVAAARTDGLVAGVVAYWAPGEAAWSPLLPGGKRTMGHACAYETALQMALHSDRAELIGTRAAGLPPRLSRPWGAGPMDFPLDDPGYYGDPAAADAATGERLLAATVDALGRYYAEFAAP